MPDREALLIELERAHAVRGAGPPASDLALASPVALRSHLVALGSGPCVAQLTLLSIAHLAARPALAEGGQVGTQRALTSPDVEHEGKPP